MANNLSPALPGIQAHPTVYGHLHTAHINFLNLNSPSIKCKNSTVLLLRRLVRLMNLNSIRTLILHLMELY